MNDNRRPTGNGGFFGDEIFSSFHHQMSRDFNRMFHEMEEIMREFNHGNFGFIEGKFPLSSSQLENELICNK